MIKFEMKFLNELCEINIGKTPARANESYWNGTNPWLSIADMKNKYLTSTKEGITDIAIEKCNMKLIPRDTVVMSFKLSIGKLAILKEDMYSNEAIASFPIFDKGNLLPEYLYYALKTVKLDQLADKAAKGVTLNKKKLNQIKIPYIDIDKQKSIVKFMRTVEDLNNKRQCQINLLDELIDSIFIEMFGDPRMNCEKIHEVPLQDLLVDIKGGGTPSKKVLDYYENGVIPWVTPKDMKKLYINSSKINITEEAVENSSANYIPEKSLLMVIRSGILKRYLPIAINQRVVTINQDMKALIPNEELIKVEYLYTFFKLYQNVLLNKVRSVTADNLDFKDIKSIKIPLPTVDKQIEFKRIFKEIQGNKKILETQKNNMEDLYLSMLYKVFKGELSLDFN